MDAVTGLEIGRARFEGDGARARLTLAVKAGDPQAVEWHELEDHGWGRDEAPGSLVLWRDAPGRPFSVDLAPWTGGAWLQAASAGEGRLALILRGARIVGSEPPAAQPPDLWPWVLPLAVRPGLAVLGLCHHAPLRVADVALRAGKAGLGLELRLSGDDSALFDPVGPPGPGWRVERGGGFLRAAWGAPGPPDRWDLGPALGTGELLDLSMEEGTLDLKLRPDAPATWEAVAASAPFPLARRAWWGQRSLSLPDGAEAFVSVEDGDLSLSFYAGGG
jgi:hypothetical protein